MAFMKQLFGVCLLLLLVGESATNFSDTDYEDEGKIAEAGASPSPETGASPTPETGASPTPETGASPTPETGAPTTQETGAPTTQETGAPTTQAPTTQETGAPTTQETGAPTTQETGAPPATDTGATTNDPNTPGQGESTTIPSTPEPGPCASNPCPLDSTCQTLLSNYTCECRPGLVYDMSQNTCDPAKTFPTDIKLISEEYDVQMSDKNSKIFQETAERILSALKKTFKKPGYLGSTVLSLKKGSVIAEVNNFFSTSSDITEDTVKGELEAADGILKGAEVTYKDVCTTGFCNPDSTDCASKNGIATCTCMKEYIQITATQQACIACPSGQKAVDSKECVNCPFGYSGLNCDDPYLLVVVVISCILGPLLLGTLIGAVVLYTRSKKTTKYSEKPSTNGVNSNMEFTKPAGIPRIPRANPNSGWQPSNLEMTDSGSRNALVMKDRSENTGMWNYDYPEDRRSYKSQTSSRPGYGPSVSNNLPRATRNPYYDAYDDNVRRY